jgi:hypothetical protein
MFLLQSQQSLCDIGKQDPATGGDVISYDRCTMSGHRNSKLPFKPRNRYLARPQSIDQRAYDRLSRRPRTQPTGFLYRCPQLCPVVIQLSETEGNGFMFRANPGQQLRGTPRLFPSGFQTRWRWLRLAFGSC